MKKLKNAARRAKTQYGYVYDPWASVWKFHLSPQKIFTEVLCSGMSSIFNATQIISTAWTVTIPRSIM